MNYLDFRKRYIEKLVSTGLYTAEQIEADDEKTRFILHVFVSHVVAMEYQVEEIEKAAK